MTLPSPPFLSAILLAEEESRAAVDRRSLRGAGIRHVRVVTSGCEVARFLAENIPNLEEVIVCPPRMADMDAKQFAVLIRSHPLLPHVPLVALTANSAGTEELLEAGFNAVLQRPFNTSELLKALQEAARRCRKAHAALAAWLRTQDRLPDHSRFDELLEACTPVDHGTLTAREACRRGMLLLRERKWNEALPLLQKAAVDIDTCGDACTALAALYKARGDQAKYAQSLRDSLRGYVDIQAWGKAGQVAACLARELPGENHPLLTELERAARQGKVFVAQELMEMLLPEHAENTPGVSLDAILDALNRGLAALPPERAADARETLELALLQNGSLTLAHALNSASESASVSAEPSASSGSSAGMSAYPEATLSSLTAASSAGAASGSPPISQNSAHDDAEEASEDNSADTATDSPDEEKRVISTLPPTAPPPLKPSRLPYPLGEIVTVIRGTLRLYKASK